MRVIYKLQMVVVLMLLGSLASADEKFRFVMQEFPPFNWTEDGKAVGPVIDVVAAVCNKINAECPIEVEQWTVAQRKTAEGDFDGLITIGWNERREPWLYFSYPIVQTEYGLFAEASSTIDSVEPLTQFHNKIIAAYGPSNTSYKLGELKENAAKQNINIETYITSLKETGFQQAADKTAIAVFSNREVGFTYLKQLHLENKLKYLGAAFPPIFYYIGFSKANGPDKYISFNQAYYDLYSSGEIKKILDKYDQTYGDFEKGSEKTATELLK